MAGDSMGKDGFTARHDLWTDEQKEAAERVAALVKEKAVEIVRLSFADQHGILRGKTVAADILPQTFRSGCALTTTLLVKDTAHKTIYPVWKPGGDIAELTGAGDFLMVPDPTTFRILPWTDNTGWMLCDIYWPDGRPVPFSSRKICRDVIGRLGALGYDYVTGLEVEFHLFRIEDAKTRPEHATQPGAPMDVSLLNQGFQYLTESRMDELEPILNILRRNLEAIGLPLRTMEVEFGPSQVEVTFAPETGIQTADNMVLFRSAVRQIAKRQGYHASFMCRPHLPNCFSSGWHLHQSLVEKASGRNVFMPDNDGEILSETGRRFVAGLLAHAPAACVFTTPTINGYKRYRPYSLAPDRVLWGRDNRGAMLRVIGGPGDSGTRVENRVGESGANPYLYLASQALCGLHGLENTLTPTTPADAPYDTDAALLPRSLMDSVAALRDDTMFRDGFGEGFVKYITALKEAEIGRFLSETTDWEQREYFGLF